MALEEIQARLKQGKPVHFTEPVRPETLQQRADRTIQAAWLHELVDQPNRVFSVAVDIKNAIIASDLALRDVQFKGPFSITESEFDHVDLSFTVFDRGLRLSGSQFRSLNCDGSRV